MKLIGLSEIARHANDTLSGQLGKLKDANADLLVPLPVGKKLVAWPIPEELNRSTGHRSLSEPALFGYAAYVVLPAEVVARLLVEDKAQVYELYEAVTVDVDGQLEKTRARVRPPIPALIKDSVYASRKQWIFEKNKFGMFPAYFEVVDVHPVVAPNEAPAYKGFEVRIDQIRLIKQQILSFFPGENSYYRKLAEKYCDSLMSSNSVNRPPIRLVALVAAAFKYWDLTPSGELLRARKKAIVADLVSGVFFPGNVEARMAGSQADYAATAICHGYPKATKKEVTPRNEASEAVPIRKDSRVQREEAFLKSGIRMAVDAWKSNWENTPLWDDTDNRRDRAAATKSRTASETHFTDRGITKNVASALATILNQTKAPQEK